jgi:hypothetical protein
MSPVFGAKMRIATFACLILTTAIPTRPQRALGQPADGPIPPGMASSPAGSLYIQGHEAEVRDDLPAALGLLDQGGDRTWERQPGPTLRL